MKKIYLALGLVAGLALSSCSVDTEPSTALPDSESITKLRDMENALNGIGYLLSEDRMTYGAEYGIYADLLTNDYMVADDYGQSSPISRYTLTKYDELPDAAYYYYYKAIANCNKAFYEGANLEGEDVDYVRGQLYAWRGLLHFDLARMFAHLPTTVSDVNAANSGIVLSTEVYASDYKGTRSTLKETYDQIIDDYTKAMSLMDKDAKKVNGYMNYYAALALRARAYLYMGEYDKALADAKEVIADGGYVLYNPDNYENAWAQEGTSESIFELLITSVHNPQRNSLGFYTDADGYPECAFNEEGELYSYLAANTNDVRSKLIKSQKIGNSGPYMFPAKYPGRGMSYVNNPKIIRLSEVYLIAAEAELLGNNDAAAAAEYINEIERNRVTDYTDIASVTIDDILFEYKKELFCENHSAFAYWRNKKSVTNQVGKEIAYDNDRTIMPIPQREIDYNPDLVQNNGY